MTTGLALAALTALLAGLLFSGPALGTGLIAAELRHQGILRLFHLRLPPGHPGEQPRADTAVDSASGAAGAASEEPATDGATRFPVVLALHGGGGTGRAFDRGTTAGTLSAAAAERGMILVFPQGVRRGWQDGRAVHADRPALAQSDDVGFLEAVINHVVERYRGDPGRIYATGISNGGFMSLYLGLQRPDLVAAIAPVTAQLAEEHQDLEPSAPLPMLLINGTADPLVPFDGGPIAPRNEPARGSALSTRETLARFREFNGCDGPPEDRLLPDLDPDDGTRVRVERSDGCADGSEVVGVFVEGGGHAWPGGNQYLPPRWIGPVSRDLDASALILDFFLRHRRD